MNEVYVFDKNFNMIGIIDEYISCIWRPAYYDIGDFELYLAASDKAVNLLQREMRLVRACDMEEDEQGNIVYRKIMIIKKIVLNTDVENGDFLTVTGKELKTILNQRIVWQQTILTNTTPERGIRWLVKDNAVNPSYTLNRAIPNLIFADEKGIAGNLEKQVTGDKLDAAVTDICKTYNLGWDIYFKNGKMIFDIYEGADRSYNQTERPYVVFSEDFDNLYNTEYELDCENYANTALIGGEGEGLERIYTTVGDEAAGLERYETFVDVRDISQNKGNEDEIPLNTYLSMLKEKGVEKLAETAYTEGFSGEVLHDISFVYGVDFYMGDIVTVINRYGITKDVRVLSAIESEDESGAKLIPQFNI